MISAILMAGSVSFVGTPTAEAQDLSQIVSELEANGYYIESGADATASEMQSLVDQGSDTSEQWYFVVLSGPARAEYAADVRDVVRPVGNVIVHSVETDAEGDFDAVNFATGSAKATEERALRAFDTDWSRPADYMDDVIADFAAAASAGTSSDSSTGSSSGPGSSGGGFPWWLLVVLAALGGGAWFMSQRGKKRREDEALETAQKIRAELQNEIDELANDVLVLSGPTDLSDKPQAIEYYREATDTYLDTSEEILGFGELKHVDLAELSDFGARVAHARWQMDAAEAIMDGEPLPEKPKVEPPPPPAQPPQQPTPQQRQQHLPQRAPRERVPYSPSPRRSGGGLLDVLIAGAGTMASGRGRSGGRSSGSRRSQSSPRSGGGFLGGNSRSESSGRSSSRRSTSRSSSSRRQSSSSRSSGSRSTSKRRRR
jgi:hypothetical protein